MDGKHNAFFENVKQSLLEAVEMEKGNIPLVKRGDMPAPTFVAEGVLESKRIPR